MRLTRKKSIELCIELWTWCAKTGKRKHSWLGWKEYSILAASDCWFCEYSKRRKKQCGGDTCQYCPLKQIEISHCKKSYYKEWNIAITMKARKKYAKLFLEQIKSLRSK